jgi:hypothetical protein
MPCCSGAGGVGSIPANSDAQTCLLFRRSRWRFEMTVISPRWMSSQSGEVAVESDSSGDGVAGSCPEPRCLDKHSAARCTGQGTGGRPPAPGRPGRGFGFEAHRSASCAMASGSGSESCEYAATPTRHFFLSNKSVESDPAPPRSHGRRAAVHAIVGRAARLRKLECLSPHLRRSAARRRVRNPAEPSRTAAAATRAGSAGRPLRRGRGFRWRWRRLGAVSRRWGVGRGLRPDSASDGRFAIHQP